jgi:F-type H+-transporting ATPase subunit gamma
MTESLQDLERRIESATELHSITRTMRGLAAVNLRHHEHAAAASSMCEGIIAAGLQVVLRDGGLERLPAELPASSMPTALIVFGSNQGLCGPVNRAVVAHALHEAEQLPSLARIGAVGQRLSGELELAGLDAETTWDLPGTVEAITPRSTQVLVDVEQWNREDGITRVVLVFPDYVRGVRSYEPTTMQLAPTDRRWLERLAGRSWRSRSLPTYTMEWERLVAALVHEAMLVHLQHTFAQTMASVAASRLAAMDAAQRDIEERLDRLRTEHQLLRQSEITEELLDVVSGFEVLRAE